jgi:hypothetical protein
VPKRHRRFFSEICQQLRLQQDHAAALEPDPVPPFPTAKLLVRHFARQSDDLTDVALGNFGPALAIIGKLRQSLGKPRRRIQEHHVLNLLRRLEAFAATMPAS